MTKEGFPPACPESTKISYLADGLRTGDRTDAEVDALRAHAKSCAACTNLIRYRLLEALKDPKAMEKADVRMFPSLRTPPAPPSAQPE